MTTSQKRAFCAFAALSVVVASVAAWPMTRPQTGYESLDDLVAELAAALERGDENRVNQLCMAPLGVPFERLQEQNHRLHYLTLLRENDGWRHRDSWGIGGHGPRFGCIHVEFLKLHSDKWHIERIWMCR